MAVPLPHHGPGGHGHQVAAAPHRGGGALGPAGHRVHVPLGHHLGAAPEGPLGGALAGHHRGVRAPGAAHALTAAPRLLVRAADADAGVGAHHKGRVCQGTDDRLGAVEVGVE